MQLFHNMAAKMTAEVTALVARVLARPRTSACLRIEQDAWYRQHTGKREISSLIISSMLLTYTSMCLLEAVTTFCNRKTGLT